jgi:BirA family biotin operon repressor/biotin-[acetyl-CoA-carboxylase] ligase
LTSISELTFFGTPLLYFNEIESTNDYLKKIESAEPLLVITDYQKNGRGQYGRTWESECSKNLCFSFQFYPKNLAIDQGFKISQSIALALVDSLNEFIYPEKAYIKWPNDIIIKNKKICGILIEPSIQNNNIQKVVVGIGLNVNQILFPENMPNASSLSILFQDRTWERINVIKKIISQLEERLEKGLADNILLEYNRHLYKINEDIILSKNEIKSRYTNLGVNQQGHWMVRSIADNLVLELVSSREIEYVYG